MLARFGGEEFSVVLPETDLAAAQQIAERLLDAVRHTTIRQAPEWPLTVSIGIATSTSDQPQRPTDLMTTADTALYTAKNTGRNRSIAGSFAPIVPVSS